MLSICDIVTLLIMTINQAINEAARILGLSNGQVKRLKKGVLELGPHPEA
ncbi:MAG TPA: hypothetical protein GXX39_08275 [Syntrophothermus lipocalidus]|nr:hypothetical protein [Syntrophothermus lipocalidus]HHV77349.1 hypothetical protein [Syntrophothermus lipocalidus]